MRIVAEPFFFEKRSPIYPDAFPYCPTLKSFRTVHHRGVLVSSSSLEGGLSTSSLFS